MLAVVPDDRPGQQSGKDAPRSLIDEIVGEGALRTLAEAPQAEVPLYLHGLSMGDFFSALSQFLGSGTGLSAAVIARLTSVGIPAAVNEVIARARTNRLNGEWGARFAPLALRWDHR